MSELNIATAVAVLIRGGVIAYPTEGVWGIGCIPFDGEAVHRLLAIKRRPVEKGLILVGADAAQFDAVVDWTALAPEARDRVLASWPGPHTWVVPASPAAPSWVTGGRGSIAVRASAHPLVAALCAQLGGPLVSTSANLTGQPPARDRAGLSPALIALLDGVCEGETGGRNVPTSIRDAHTGELLRE
ncbi:tRNA threonylcarbamoyladenosine biosynthesis protein RimN [Lysobacter sp. TY2-98]|uniref:Sua5/YciO/YrdC/YwlC family protein n=1 Tax=Lysobacter sp. TY2-98 TaxID=2290922 RepID=UPI000E206A49|nr:Sua5/YciO/YrdC/YwlC family protein [Lysobacter sp. TY2-98]AXK73397.1 tRNA threonylcarbamoyladenosine biosynthesis protein RimN [Lysobacter sp. TY2-98]